MSSQMLSQRSPRRELGYVIAHMMLVGAFLVPFFQAGAAEKTTTADWIEKLKDKHKEMRLRGARALGDMGTPAKTAVPDLIDCLRDRDLEIQSRAALSLAQIGPSAIPALRQGMKDEQAQVRLWAVEILGVFADEDKDSSAALIEAAEDRETGVRAAALKALLILQVEPDAAERVFQKAAKDPNPYLSLLGGMGLDRLKAKSNGNPPAQLFNPVGLLPTPKLTRDQETQLDRMIDIFIAFDNHNPQITLPLPVPRPVAAQTALCVRRLGPEGIPALVRGMNKAASLGSDCPFVSLGNVLQAAVINCNDPQQLDFVLLNLGRGTPDPASLLSGPFGLQVRAFCQQRKTDLVLLTLATEQQAAFNRMVDKATDLNDAALRVSFTEKLADARLAALCVAAQRRLHCEDDLIDRLADPDARVVLLARQCLVRLGRGTDFGPAADADAAGRLAAQKRWRAWWKQQDQNPAAVHGPDDPAPVKVSSPSEDAADAARLIADLPKAAGLDRVALLKTLRDAKGVAYTDALATATALPGEAGDLARAALADRLSRLTVGALHEKLSDGDAEVRRAAAAACAQKNDREFTPELIHLLLDESADVRAAGRSALRTLTGEDFGPAADADKKERTAAVKKWRAWWAKQKDSNPVISTDADPAEAEAARLGKEAVSALEADRPKLLAALRDGKGPAYTDALAAVIPQLDGEGRKQAREALADRLTRMTAATLRLKLAEADAEVRRAAALACAQKDERAFVPDVIPLLDDDEGFVVQAARAALKALTGEDFGPAKNADKPERTEAVKKAKAWWAKQ